MRIAGIYSYDLNLDPKIQHAVSEPYGLEKILAVAKNEGHEVELFLPLEKENGKLVNLSEEELVGKVAGFNPDLVCFTLYTCQYPAGERIAERLKEKIPNVTIVAGNRYPSFLQDRIREPFDFFVINEGEETFRELLDEIENGQKYRGVKGLAFRDGAEVILTTPRARIKDLDSLPKALRFPLILGQAYKGISLPPLSEEPAYAIMEYSRGCYGVCKFCDNKEVWNGKLSFRSPKKVVEELAELKDMGVEIFYFMDLNFTAIPKKAEQLCEEILKQGLKVSWYCMSNIDTAAGKKDLLALMKEAGCYKIAWGVESTNDSSLKKMDKRIAGRLLRNDLVFHVLEDALNAGMLNQGYYIIGFPWETAESIIQDGEKLRYLPLHQLNVGIFTPIPLSEFHAQVEGLEPNLELHDRNTLIYRHPHLNHETIKRIQEQMHHQFYSSPEYLERVKQTVKIDPRFKRAFNDYFRFLGKKVEV